MLRAMSRTRGVFAALILLAAVAGPASADPIIGGTAAHKGDFPAVVVITLLNGQALCTGTLIDPEWVVTAAHCVNPTTLMAANQAAVTSGAMVFFNTVNVQLDQGTAIGAKETIFDPMYNPSLGTSHDVGLIHLKTPVTNITPSPINLVVGKTPIGTVVTQVGFGTRQIGAGGPAGAEFVLANRTSEKCSTITELGVPLDDANLMCFSQADMKGECEGDSGGPSFAMVNGQQTIVSLTSFGDQQCASVGADTRPESVKPFLLQHIPNLPVVECNDDTMCSDGKTCFEHSCMPMPFAPTGIGAVCTGNTDCASTECASGPGSDKLCVINCTVADATTCPSGFDCLDTGGGGGACWPSATGGSGGCCDAGNHGVPTMLAGIGLVGLVLRRRRRR